MLKEIFLLINYGVRDFVYKVELCPDFIHRFFTFYTGRTLYTKPYTTGFGQGLVTTSGFKARNRFIKVYEDPVLFSTGIVIGMVCAEVGLGHVGERVLWGGLISENIVKLSENISEL